MDSPLLVGWVGFGPDRVVGVLPLLCVEVGRRHLVSGREVGADLADPGVEEVAEVDVPGRVQYQMTATYASLTGTSSHCTEAGFLTHATSLIGHCKRASRSLTGSQDNKNRSRASTYPG